LKKKTGIKQSATPEKGDNGKVNINQIFTCMRGGKKTSKGKYTRKEGPRLRSGRKKKGKKKTKKPEGRRPSATQKKEKVREGKEQTEIETRGPGQKKVGKKKLRVIGWATKKGVGDEDQTERKARCITLENARKQKKEKRKEVRKTNRSKLKTKRKYWEKGKKRN